MNYSTLKAHISWTPSSVKVEIFFAPLCCGVAVLQSLAQEPPFSVRIDELDVVAIASNLSI